ncbi:GGDEF domain-containing protein [Singulisphaera rosea]
MAVKGGQECKIGTTVLAASIALVIMREAFANPWFAILSHISIAAGTIIFCRGVRSFRGRAPHNPIAIGLGAGVSLLACAYSTFVVESLTGRIAAISPFLSVLILDAAATMARGVAPEDRPAYWSTALAFGLDGILLAIRSVEAQVTDLGTSYGMSSPLEVANVLALSIMTAFSILGMLISLNHASRRRLEALALMDPLTTLPNRRHFDRRYEEALRKIHQRPSRLALVYMDLNGFKGINDRLGHKAGDEALRVVAARLSGAVRQSDCLVRLAGDEFALLLEDIRSRDEVVRLIDRIREEVEQEAFLGGESVRLAISCGFAVYPEDVDDVSLLMHQADQAMYADKRLVALSRTG